VDDRESISQSERCREIEKRVEGGLIQAGEQDDLVREIVERLRAARESGGYWRPRLKIRWVILLGALGHGSPLALEALAELLEDRDFYLEESYDRCDDYQVSEYAFGALSRIGAPAVPLLVPTLESPSPETRQSAARALRGMGRAASEASAALESLARDPDESVRMAAGGALGAIWEGDDSQRQRIERLLAGPETRLSGMVAAWQLPIADRIAIIDRFAALLSDPDPAVRQKAVNHLASLHESADRFVGELVACLEADPSKDVRKDAMLALREVGLSDPRSVDALIRALIRNETPFASWSIGGLTLRPSALLAPYVPDVLARLNNPDDSLGAELAPFFSAALGHSAPPPVVRALASRLASLPRDDQRSHLQILGALGAMGPAARIALREIERMAAHNNKEIVRAAAKAADLVRQSTGG
jgi:HEAT repeat protein